MIRHPSIDIDDMTMTTAENISDILLTLAVAAFIAISRYWRRRGR